MAEEKEKEVNEEEQREPEKKYSDDELNALLLKKTASAVSKEFKDLGFESKDQLQEKLKKLEEIEAERMSKEEQLQAQLKEREEKEAEKDKRILESEAKLAAYKLNVDEKYISDVVRLLPDGEGTIEERMKEFLSERPLYLKKRQEDISAEHREQSGTKEDQVTARVRKAMGLS